MGKQRVSVSRWISKVRHGDHSKHRNEINENTDGAGAVTHYFLVDLGKFLNISELSILYYKIRIVVVFVSVFSQRPLETIWFPV